MGCAGQYIGVIVGFIRDFEHDFDEGIEGFFVFSFGRFDHQGFFDDEREVVGRRVEAKVHEAF